MYVRILVKKLKGDDPSHGKIGIKFEANNKPLTHLRENDQLISMNEEILNLQALN